MGGGIREIKTMADMMMRGSVVEDLIMVVKAVAEPTAGGTEPVPAAMSGRGSRLLQWHGFLQAKMGVRIGHL